MKKFFFPIVALCISTAALFSCGGSTNSGDELDSLRTLVKEQEQQLKDAEQFVQIMNTSMDSVITANASMLFKTKEGVTASREQLKENITAYKKILDAQRARVEELEKSLDNQTSSYAQQMKEVISKLTAQIEAKDAQIAELEKKVEDQNLTIEDLQNQIEGLIADVNNLTERTRAQRQTINAQTDKINEGYFVMGTKKDLKAMGLLNGGGLFTKSKLDMSTNDVKNFQKIDIRSKTVFIIPAKNAKILTQAPEDSYTLTSKDKETTLTIKNVSKFWSISKFLVIQY